MEVTDVNIRLACDRICLPAVSENEVQKLFTPGEDIPTCAGFMRGHGTYTEGEDLKASVAGVKEQVNKLISIKPLKSRYNGEIGDVVVGRVVEVQQKRWKIDTNARLESVLLLSSVNLPGGELRRRSSEDEKMMRKYLQEGDLISAEVMNVYQDGALSLHTRSLKYGKLSQGVLVKVFPSLIMRRKNHFHSLPNGAAVILGNNGFVWICPASGLEHQEDSGSAGGFIQDLEKEVPKADREVIARLKNCILALANSKMMLYDTSIIYAYEESMKFTVTELLLPDVMVDVANLTQHRLHLDIAE
ncbi:exosome complex component RRP4 [Cloeon dipterum]|uniref:exosome complex component RRP4 n=1 Tax=Cloeon dipterum TaxID=197152 RepID=UPI00321FF6C0